MSRSKTVKKDQGVIAKSANSSRRTYGNNSFIENNDFDNSYGGKERNQSERSMNTLDKVAVTSKTRGSSAFKEFRNSIKSSIGSFFNKNNTIKIAPNGLVNAIEQEESNNEITTKKPLKIKLQNSKNAKEDFMSPSSKQPIRLKNLNLKLDLHDEDQILASLVKKRSKKFKLIDKKDERLVTKKEEDEIINNQDGEVIQHEEPPPVVKKIQRRKKVANQWNENSKQCSNFSEEHYEEAQFYCLKEKLYLCEKCVEDHQEHIGQADSIKNHLATQFNSWRQLMDHSQNVTRALIDRNITKQRDMILYLKRTSDVTPDIDAFTLNVIFTNFNKRLQAKLNKIKENCKRNDLDMALEMRLDLDVLTRQL